MTLKAPITACLLSIGLALPASALTVTSISGTWENPTSYFSGYGSVDGVSGAGGDEIRWGNSMGLGRSGYDFTATPTEFDAPAGTSFVLGTFDHLNYPIQGSLLSAVDLAVEFSISGLSKAISTVFSFDHWETHNQASTCANGEANNQGLNANGCADRVTATRNESWSESFSIGGVSYVLDILGFYYDGKLMDEFWTVERATNSALLMASFREVPPEVPLPASVLLLLGGLGGLFALRRRA